MYSLTEQRAQQAEERALAAEATVVEALEKLRAAERSRGVRDDDVSTWDPTTPVSREPCCALLSSSSAVLESVSGATASPTGATQENGVDRRVKE